MLSPSQETIERKTTTPVPNQKPVEILTVDTTYWQHLSRRRRTSQYQDAKEKYISKRIESVLCIKRCLSFVRTIRKNLTERPVRTACIECKTMYWMLVLIKRFQCLFGLIRAWRWKFCFQENSSAEIFY